MSELRRQLGLADSFSLVVGTIIGSGIFLVPNLIARQLPSPGWMVAAWVLSGLLTLIGGLAYAELGAMFPRTGGQYVYLTEAWGPAVAFLSGWAALMVIYTGAIAWMARSFTLYLNHFLPLSPEANTAVAVLLIAVLTAINYCGLRPGAWLQNILTFLKLGGLIAVVGALFLSPKLSAATPAIVPTVGAFGVAMVACLLTYDGWVTLGYVGGEVKEPSRTLPRAMVLGILVVMLIYIAANVAYLRVLTPAELAASSRVAAQALERAVGSLGASIVALAVLFSVAGAVNGFALAPPRLYFAMARDHLFFHSFGEIHPRYGTPHRAVLMQGIWAAVIALTGTYETLGSFAMLAAWLFYGLSVAGLMRLRKTHPHLVRPYRMWGYPATPVLFVLVAAGFVVNTLIETPGPAFAGLGLILAGIPVYLAWKKFRYAR